MSSILVPASSVTWFRSGFKCNCHLSFQKVRDVQKSELMLIYIYLLKINLKVCILQNAMARTINKGIFKNTHLKYSILKSQKSYPSTILHHLPRPVLQLFHLLDTVSSRITLLHRRLLVEVLDSRQRTSC